MKFEYYCSACQQSNVVFDKIQHSCPQMSVIYRRKATFWAELKSWVLAFFGGANE